MRRMGGRGRKGLFKANVVDEAVSCVGADSLLQIFSIVYMYAYMNMHMYICIYICVCVNIHIYIHAYICTHTHTDRQTDTRTHPWTPDGSRPACTLAVCLRAGN